MRPMTEELRYTLVVLAVIAVGMLLTHPSAPFDAADAVSRLILGWVA